jgi:heterodisulfide reductase subunit A
MARWDKTFPTLDCAACILTPRMTQVASNPNIELMAYSEVEQISGYLGNFKVKIRHKARYVDEEKCNGCSACYGKCPAKVDSEFDTGLGKRKVIYTPFPQAVPNVPVIDRENCIYFIKGKCRACEKFCDIGAIDFEQQDSFEELDIGTIIVATGYDLFNPEPIKHYGYGKYENIYTSVELERMVNASGPTLGHIQLKDGSKPESVAIIHCVGSRDENYHKYCSRLCCMSSLKFAHLIKEHLPETEVYEFYIDIRSAGKAYEEFYRRVCDDGVKLEKRSEYQWIW